MPRGRISPDSEPSPNRRLIACWPLPEGRANRRACRRLRCPVPRNLRYSWLRPQPRRLRRNCQPIRIGHNRRPQVPPQVQQQVQEQRPPRRLLLSGRQRPQARQLRRQLPGPQPLLHLLSASLRLANQATTSPATVRKTPPLRLRPTPNCPGRTARSFSLPRVRKNGWLTAFRRNIPSKRARGKRKERLSSRRSLMRTARLRACDWSRETLPWQPPPSKP